MRICPRCRAIYSAQVDRCPSDGERVADEHVFPMLGQKLDRYKIVEALGEGAMGCVYRATHNVLPREYAIKVLFKDLASNQVLIERFRREAQAVSTMAHPNIVSVADFVTLPNGVTFIVMELVDGRTLEQAIQSEAPFPPARAAQITRQIAGGLGEAHRLGFVHRDVKPSNIMLADVQGAEQVKILDFGVVGLGAQPLASRLTAVGHIIGTPTYMAPEQVHDPSVGPAADLYALGVILFEMLAGEPPFTGGDRTQVFVKHISEPPPRLPPSDGLDLLAYWLLEKPASRRPKNADAVIQAIDRLGLLDTASLRGSDLEDILRARGQRPAISRPARLLYEDDTFKPSLRPRIEAGEPVEAETDSSISEKDVRRALADTDPSGEHSDPDVAVRPLDDDDDDQDATISPTSNADRSGETELGITTTDDLFPALAAAAAPAGLAADWSSWDPDGSYESSHGYGHASVRMELEAAPVTDPLGDRGPPIDPADRPGRAPSLAGGKLRAGRGTAELAAAVASASNAGKLGSARIVPTQLVRSRRGPLGELIGRDGLIENPLEVPTDLMLFEPELPQNNGERTLPNRLGDDGPTQVDFDVSALDPAETPVVREAEAGGPSPAPPTLPQVAWDSAGRTASEDRRPEGSAWTVRPSERPLPDGTGMIEDDSQGAPTRDAFDTTALDFAPFGQVAGLIEAPSPPELGLEPGQGGAPVARPGSAGGRDAGELEPWHELLIPPSPRDADRTAPTAGDQGAAGTLDSVRTEASVEVRVARVDDENVTQDHTETPLIELAALGQSDAPAEFDPTPLIAIDIPVGDQGFDRAMSVLRASHQASTVEDVEKLQRMLRANGPMSVGAATEEPAAQAATLELAPSESRPPARPDLRKLVLTFGIGFLLCIALFAIVLLVTRALSPQVDVEQALPEDVTGAAGEPGPG